MSSNQLLNAVMADVRGHCEAKGYREAPGVNNFVPHDAVAAFAMAKLLTEARFDVYLAIAPERHIYGYFFEKLGVPVSSLFVDYPPTSCTAEHEDLGLVRDKNVLLIEDDVRSGRTLRLVIEHLRLFGPRSLHLYVGHGKGVQVLENVPRDIGEVYVAEDLFSWDTLQELEPEFERFFAGRLLDARELAEQRHAATGAARRRCSLALINRGQAWRGAHHEQICAYSVMTEARNCTSVVLESAIDIQMELADCPNE